MKRRAIATAAILVAVVAASPVIARRAIGVHVEVPRGGIRGEPVRVYYPPDPDQPLNLRFAWTRSKAERHADHDAWIAYECRSVFPPAWVYGTLHARPPQDRARRAPRGVLLHSTRERSRSPDAADLVVLLRLRAKPGAEWSVLWAAARTPGMELDPQDLPVYWIGAGDGEESIALLAWLGSFAADPGARESLVDVIAVHRDSAATVSHLSGILAGDPPENVRAAAAAGLAWHAPAATTGSLTVVPQQERSKGAAP